MSERLPVHRGSKASKYAEYCPHFHPARRPWLRLARWRRRRRRRTCPPLDLASLRTARALRRRPWSSHPPPRPPPPPPAPPPPRDSDHQQARHAPRASQRCRAARRRPAWPRHRPSSGRCTACTTASRRSTTSCARCVRQDRPSVPPVSPHPAPSPPSPPAPPPQPALQPAPPSHAAGAPRAAPGLDQLHAVGAIVPQRRARQRAPPARHDARLAWLPRVAPQSRRRRRRRRRRWE